MFIWLRCLQVAAHSRPQSKFNFVLFCIREIQGLSFANCASEQLDHKSKCNSINFRPSDALFVTPFHNNSNARKMKINQSCPDFVRCLLPSQKFCQGCRWMVPQLNTHCDKITEKVSFNIASEASYVYTLGGQKLISKNGPFWQVFENLKFAVKQCYQTGQF